MGETSYKKSFLLAVVINFFFLLFLSYVVQHSLFVDIKDRDLVVQIDMSQYEVSTTKQGNQQEVVKSTPGGNTSVGNPSSAMSENSVSGVTSRTPYLGGVESASVGVAGASVSGIGGEAKGGTGAGIGEGLGAGSGIGSGDGQNGGTGYVDVDSYMAKLNSMKKYPQQALRRNLEGSVHFMVTFDVAGNMVDYQITGGSYDVLNNAASALIERGGRIVNTTGTTQTVPITIHYFLQ